MKKIRKAWIILVALIAIFFLLNGIANTMIFTRFFKIKNDKVNKEVEEFRILQLSDIHSVRSEKMLKKLVNKIKEQVPDIICITGDLIDSTYHGGIVNEHKMNEDSSLPDIYTLEFIEKIIGIAPVYYVYGNHEMMLLDMKNTFVDTIEKLGVQMMNNQSNVIRWEGIEINLLGIQDPATLYRNPTYAYIEKSEDKIRAMLDDVTDGINEDLYTILLSHRPEFFTIYQEYPIDLVLSGHVHGGQAIIPFIGGAYGPGQGWFPKYYSGLYESSNMKMIVNRGIGNSRIPFRICNPPQIILVKLILKNE